MQRPYGARQPVAAFVQQALPRGQLPGGRCRVQACAAVLQVLRVTGEDVSAALPQGGIGGDEPSQLRGEAGPWVLRGEARLEVSQATSSAVGSRTPGGAEPHGGFVSRTIEDGHTVAEVRKCRPLLEAQQGHTPLFEPALQAQRELTGNAGQPVAELRGLAHDEFRGL